MLVFFFSSRSRHTRLQGDWSSAVCSSDLFRGGGEVCVTLVGTHVDSTVNNPIECASHWKAGRVRPLAVFDTARIAVAEWKDIPTVKESLGVDVHYLMLRGIFGPPSMPKDAVDWDVGVLKQVYDTP